MKTFAYYHFVNYKQHSRANAAEQISGAWPKYKKSKVKDCIMTCEQSSNIKMAAWPVNIVQSNPTWKQ